MSCYILPAGSSTLVNFAAVYQSPMVIAGSTPLQWSPATTPVAGRIKLPVTTTALGASCGADQLATTAAVALFSPEVASSLVYQSLDGNRTSISNGSVNTHPVPVSTSCASFCCVAPYPAVAAASTTSSNFPFSVKPYPEVGNGTAMYNCTGLSTFHLVPSGLPQSVSLSSTSAATAPSSSARWRCPQGVATTGSPYEFYRLRRLLRRVRRRVAAGLTSSVDCATSDVDETTVGAGCERSERYPLFCVVCRVKLNASIQAKQHYSGRSHARRVRLLYGPSTVSSATCNTPSPSVDDHSPTKSDGTSVFRSASESDESGDSKPVSLSSVCDGPVQRPMYPAGTITPVSCDVYCSACAVSFNSTTQARQHYHGKSHAKRLRTITPVTAPDKPTVHKDANYTCLICNARPDTNAHHCRMTSSRSVSRPLKRSCHRQVRLQTMMM